METVDNILKMLGIVSTIATVWLLVKEAPLKLRSSKIESEGKALDNYNKVIVRLAGQDDQITKLISQLNSQSDLVEKQEDQLQELNKASVRHSNELADAHREVAAGHLREDELKKLTVQQRKLIDSIPERMDLYDAELAKLGVVLPPNPIVEAARAAIERQEGKVAAATPTAPAAEAAAKAIEAVSTAIDEAKKPPAEPDTPKKDMP